MFLCFNEIVIDATYFSALLFFPYQKTKAGLVISSARLMEFLSTTSPQIIRVVNPYVKRPILNEKSRHIVLFFYGGAYIIQNKQKILSKEYLIVFPKGG
jgi:hypothetical protein